MQTRHARKRRPTDGILIIAHLAHWRNCHACIPLLECERLSHANTFGGKPTEKQAHELRWL
jgi:hypothetical protein